MIGGTNQVLLSACAVAVVVGMCVTGVWLWCRPMTVLCRSIASVYRMIHYELARVVLPYLGTKSLHFCELGILLLLSFLVMLPS